MNVSDALLKRKSIRAFTNQEVSQDLIIQILDKARYSPSGTNTQPWEVAVVTGRKKYELDNVLLNSFKNNEAKNMDYNYYPLKLSDVLQERRRACGLQMYSALGITTRDTDKRVEQWAKNYTAFGAPCVIFIFADKCIEKGSYLDLGMFIQSIMLMATELGLATCAQASLAEQPQIVKKLLDNYYDKILICGIAIGYEDSTNVINSYRTAREEVNKFTRFY